MKILVILLVTVTEHFAINPLLVVAIIFVVPASTAVIFPFLSTFATFSFSLDQVTVLSIVAFSGLIVAF